MWRCALRSDLWHFHTASKPGPYGTGTRSVHPLQHRKGFCPRGASGTWATCACSLCYIPVSGLHVQDGCQPPGRLVLPLRRMRAGLFSTGASIVHPTSAAAFVIQLSGAAAGCWQFLPSPHPSPGKSSLARELSFPALTEHAPHLGKLAALSTELHESIIRYSVVCVCMVEQLPRLRRSASAFRLSAA